MSSPSLDIVISYFRWDIIELGFEPTEDGFNKIHKQLLDYHRIGFRYENNKLITPARVDQTSPEALRYRDIYYLYCKIIKLEADTDFLEDKY